MQLVFILKCLQQEQTRKVRVISEVNLSWSAQPSKRLWQLLDMVDRIISRSYPRTLDSIDLIEWMHVINIVYVLTE